MISQLEIQRKEYARVKRVFALAAVPKQTKKTAMPIDPLCDPANWMTAPDHRWIDVLLADVAAYEQRMREGPHPGTMAIWRKRR